MTFYKVLRTTRFTTDEDSRAFVFSVEAGAIVCCTFTVSPMKTEFFYGHRHCCVYLTPAGVGMAELGEHLERIGLIQRIAI